MFNFLASWETGFALEGRWGGGCDWGGGWQHVRVFAVQQRPLVEIWYMTWNTNETQGYFQGFKGVLKLFFLPVIWKHHAKVIIFFKRNYFKGILNLFQRENVLRSQGLYNSNLLSIWSKKMCRPFLPLTITIINVSLYNFLFFVYLETPSWPSFLCVCVCVCVLFFFYMLEFMQLLFWELTSCSLNILNISLKILLYCWLWFVLESWFQMLASLNTLTPVV